MTSTTLLRAACTCCLLAAGIGSGAAQTAPHQDFVCVSGASRRIISVFNLESTDGGPPRGGCRVDYTKDGATRTLYTSRSGRAYCAAKAAVLVTNLVRGNYACRAETLENPEDNDVPETRSKP